jgi:hypothetical protein
LQTLATDTLMTALADSISGRTDLWRVWTNESWKKLKLYLHDLPQDILEAIYEQIWDQFNETRSLHKNVRDNFLPLKLQQIFIQMQQCLSVNFGVNS